MWNIVICDIHIYTDTIHIIDIRDIPMHILYPPLSNPGAVIHVAGASQRRTWHLHHPFLHRPDPNFDGKTQ